MHQLQEPWPGVGWDREPGSPRAANVQREVGRLHPLPKIQNVKYRHNGIALYCIYCRVYLSINDTYIPHVDYRWAPGQLELVGQPAHGGVGLGALCSLPTQPCCHPMASITWVPKRIRTACPTGTALTIGFSHPRKSRLSPFGIQREAVEKLDYRTHHLDAPKGEDSLCGEVPGPCRPAACTLPQSNPTQMF